MSDPMAAVFDALTGVAGDLRLRQAEEVARAYAGLLARSSADRAGIADESQLPYAKDAIRHALLMLLAAMPTTALREPLRFAFLRLAEWQPADPPAAAIDLASARATRDPLAMASRLAAGRAPLAERRRAAAAAERARLAEELRRHGYG